jgi:hypothetical protein
VRLLWSAEQKATPHVAPIAAHACRFAAHFLGLGAAADNAPLPRQASRGLVHRAIQSRGRSPWAA